MQAQVELKQMTPKAEIINGRVRIHEHDESVGMFEFKLGDGVPHLPICGELVEKMQEFAQKFQVNKSIVDKKERYEANVAARRELWVFANQVENVLNEAVSLAQASKTAQGK